MVNIVLCCLQDVHHSSTLYVPYTHGIPCGDDWDGRSHPLELQTYLPVVHSYRRD